MHFSGERTCPEGDFANSFRVLYVPISKSYDNSGIEDLRLTCRDSSKRLLGDGGADLEKTGNKCICWMEWDNQCIEHLMLIVKGKRISSLGSVAE